MLMELLTTEFEGIILPTTKFDVFGVIGKVEESPFHIQVVRVGLGIEVVMES